MAVDRGHAVVGAAGVPVRSGLHAALPTSQAPTAAIDDEPPEMELLDGEGELPAPKAEASYVPPVPGAAAAPTAAGAKRVIWWSAGRRAALKRTR